MIIGVVRVLWQPMRASRTHQSVQIETVFFFPPCVTLWIIVELSERQHGPWWGRSQGLNPVLSGNDYGKCPNTRACFCSAWKQRLAPRMQGRCLQIYNPDWAIILGYPVPINNGNTQKSLHPFRQFSLALRMKVHSKSDVFLAPSHLTVVTWFIKSTVFKHALFGQTEVILKTVAQEFVARKFTLLYCWWCLHLPGSESFLQGLVTGGGLWDLSPRGWYRHMGDQNPTEAGPLDPGEYCCKGR